MKNIIMILTMLGLFAFSTTQASNDCKDCAEKKKVTHNKVIRSAGDAASSGYYYTTHNKLTKVLKINDGNIKRGNTNKATRSAGQS